MTLLFVGHGLGAVNYVSNRIAVMYLGRIVEMGEAKEIFNHPVHPYTKALLEAVPVPDPEAEEKERGILQGEIGSSEAPTAGCRFHPRCPYATKACGEKEPDMREVAECGSGAIRQADRGSSVMQAAEHGTEACRGHYVACPRIMEK